MILRQIKGSEIAAWAGGDLLGKDWLFNGFFQVDSRNIAPGDVFVALRGKSSDGHDHVLDALARGASGALVSSDWMSGRVVGLRRGFVVLDDVESGLISLARNRFSQVEWSLGITGSVGKTTVREMIYRAVSSEMSSVYRARNSHNTLIGCALTLAEMPRETKGVILEMGTNHPGEIAEMVEAFPVDMALITKVAPAHLEGLGDLDGVIRAKTEILNSSSLQKAIIGGEDRSFLEHVHRLSKDKPWSVISVGAGSDKYNILAKGFSWSNSPTVYADIALSDGEIVRVSAELLGEHNAFLLALAFTVAVELGLDPQKTANRLASFKAFKGRGELGKKNGIITIDESYNANPESMAAVLSFIKNSPIPRSQVFLVLGEMGELGECSDEYHRLVWEQARELGEVFLVGDSWGSFVEESKVWKDLDDLGIHLKKTTSPGSLVLIKGSRSNRLERLWRFIG